MMAHYVNVLECLHDFTAPCTNTHSPARLRLCVHHTPSGKGGYLKAVGLTGKKKNEQKTLLSADVTHRKFEVSFETVLFFLVDAHGTNQTVPARTCYAA